MVNPDKAKKNWENVDTVWKCKWECKTLINVRVRSV